MEPRWCDRPFPGWLADPDCVWFRRPDRAIECVDLHGDFGLLGLECASVELSAVEPLDASHGCFAKRSQSVALSFLPVHPSLRRDLRRMVLPFAGEHLIHDRLRDGFEAFPVPGGKIEDARLVAADHPGRPDACVVERDRKPALSPARFNELTGTPVVLPITTGGSFARRRLRPARATNRTPPSVAAYYLHPCGPPRFDGTISSIPFDCIVRRRSAMRRVRGRNGCGAWRDDDFRW